MIRSASATLPPCTVTVMTKAAAAEIAMARRMGTRRSGRMSMISAGASAHGEMTKLSARASSMVSSTVTMGVRKESTV